MAWSRAFSKSRAMAAAGGLQQVRDELGGQGDRALGDRCVALQVIGVGVRVAVLGRQLGDRCRRLRGLVLVPPWPYLLKYQLKNRLRVAVSQPLKSVAKDTAKPNYTLG
jgi:hypothetical protein